MKKSTGHISVIIAILCLFFIFSLFASAKQTESTATLQYAQYDENYVANTKTRTAVIVSQEIKDLLKEAVLNTQASVDVGSYNIPYSKEYLQMVGDFLYNEVPEAFHLTEIRCQYYTSGEFANFKFTYSNSAEEYAQMFAQCTQAADKMLSGIKNNDDLTDVEKALLVHDRLALHCAYGDVKADDSETSTIYAALIGRRPVCQGYAEAYMFLLRKIGIECHLVSSDTLFHAWNIVYIDGKPYHVDVTWDDPTGDRYGRVKHNNFLLSTDALKTGVGDSKPHNATDFDTSPVDTKYDNAYWQCSEAAFQLIDDEIYYIDSTEQKIKKASDHAALCSVEGIWRINSTTGAVQGNHAKLACVNNTLLCSMPTAVYTIDLKTGSKTEFIKPTLAINGETFYSILGFAYENGMLYFDYCKLSGDGYISTAKTSVSAPAIPCAHLTTEARNEKSATCGKDGYSGDIYCSDCDQLITKGSTIPANGNHTWNNGVITKVANCHETGERTYTCTVCSDTKTTTIAINANNHNGEEEIIGQLAATCGKDGYSGDIYCTGCDQLLTKGNTVSASGNHTWNSGVITKVANCHETGVRTYTCTVCSDTKTTTIAINANNHDGEEEIIGQLAATCGKDGYSGDIYCTGCDQLLTKGSTVSASGDHSWDDGIITKEPTSSEDGIKTHTCSICNQTKEESIAMTDMVELGDIDGDGKITATDARLALRASVGLETLSTEEVKLADVDRDNSISAADARYILRFSVGLDKKWPGEQ